MKPQLRRFTLGSHHLDVTPEHSLRMPGAERLHGSFFRGKPAGEMRGRILSPSRVRNFTFGEDAMQKTVAVPIDRCGNPINFRGIQSDADNICRHVPPKAYR
jgi:hypothetical protein